MLKELPIDWQKPQIIVSIGKPRSSKSNTVKYYILKNSLPPRNIYKFGIVFVKTKFSGGYKYIKDEYVHAGWDEDVFQQYIDSLEEEYGENIPRNYIVLDDLVSVIDRNNPVLSNFVSCHRHYNCDLYINTQYLYSSVNTPLFRECTSIAFMFNTKGKRGINGLYEAYGQLFDSFEEFREHFLKVTKEKYNAMVFLNDIDNKHDNYLQFKSPNMDDVDLVLDY